MFARQPEQVRANRLRAAAPIAALAGPLLLVILAALNVLLPCTGSACTDLERRSLVLLSAGAPAFPALVALPGALPLGLSILGGAVLSVPLWALLGRRVADRAVDAGGSWRQFWQRYAIAFGVWCAVVVVAATVLRRSLS